MPMLEVKNLGISFGGLRAVDDFNLSIEKGELYGLIGPNGAGKTTVFNMLTGVYKPTDGKILLDGEDVTGKKTIELNKEGIARTFQNIRLFSDLSVLDNVKVALHNQKEFTYSALTGILRLPRFYRLEKEMDERAMELLEVFGLDKEAGYKASNLPYGKQRELEIARAMATNPKLLLLDEPAAGMNPNETQSLMNTIRFVRDKLGISRTETIGLIKVCEMFCSGTNQLPSDFCIYTYSQLLEMTTFEQGTWKKLNAGISVRKMRLLRKYYKRGRWRVSTDTSIEEDLKAALDYALRERQAQAEKASKIQFIAPTTERESKCPTSDSSEPIKNYDDIPFRVKQLRGEVIQLCTTHPEFFPECNEIMRLARQINARAKEIRLGLIPVDFNVK